IHESTHALNDWHKRYISDVEDEACAYIAQMVFTFVEKPNLQWALQQPRATLAVAGILQQCRIQRDVCNSAAVAQAGYLAIDLDPDGNVSIIWYDTRRDPADHLLDVFGTLSADGGRTFSPNFRVTDQSFDADAGKFTDATGHDNSNLGDAIGLATVNGMAYAA